MGEQSVDNNDNVKKRSVYIKHLLDDIRSLEYMLENNLIENDIVRIGSEQEVCIVSQNWRPSKVANKVLDTIDDEHFTTELARYNLEINLDPIELKNDCFTQVENQLNTLLKKAKEAAKKHKTRVILTGILPTISKNELELEYLTPLARYEALNKRMKEVKGQDFELYIRGVDELTIKHDSVLFEACNTSFQMHLQISPDDFISSYNWSQAISGPLLGICSNSPLLLGRELWSETRIALFQQSIDTRSSSYALKNQQARVSFGNDWAYGSVAEFYKNNIAQHKVILTKDIEKSSLEVLKSGVSPKLHALNLHNGTVYCWNRPCYGVENGKAHIRIENRYIPSGPTTLDEMANFVFWVGLMKGRPKKYNNIAKLMSFKEAKSNFVKAARMGRSSIMEWMGESISIRDLILKEFLPIARDGLKKMSINEDDINRFLSVIEKRTVGQTGSQWKIKNYRELCKYMKQDDALIELTKALHKNENSGLAIHDWPDISDFQKKSKTANLISHVMSTQLFTLNENDLAELATNLMEWKNIHHIPIENNAHKLSGLLTKTHLNKYKKQLSKNTLVSDIMTKELITVEPNTTINKAIKLMKKYNVGCLPIVTNENLVGIVTIEDLIEFN